MNWAPKHNNELISYIAIAVLVALYLLAGTLEFNWVVM
jgi:hypothetical protein